MPNKVLERQPKTEKRVQITVYFRPLKNSRRKPRSRTLTILGTDDVDFVIDKIKGQFT